MNVKPMTWQAMELWGMLHIMVPQSDKTLCGATMNMNGEQTTVTHIVREIGCRDCRKTARVLQIPTAF